MPEEAERPFGAVAVKIMLEVAPVTVKVFVDIDPDPEILYMRDEL